MNDILQIVADMVTPMSRAIGNGAQYGWDIVVRQQYAIGIVLIVTAILSAIEAYVGYRVIKWAQAQPRENKEVVEHAGYSNEKRHVVFATQRKYVWAMFFGYLSQVNWIIAKVALVSGILYMYNPEFFAIQFFVSLIK